MRQTATSRIHRGPDRPGATAARRLFWFALLLLHGAAIPSLWAAISRGGEIGTLLPLTVRIAGMSASAAFFVLKIADVSWLRLNGGWRSVVAAVLVVAVLHVGVLDRALHGDVALNPAQLSLVLCLGTLGYTEPLARIIGLLLAVLAPLRFSRTLGRPRSPAFARVPAFKPHALFYVPSFTGPRAPPSSAR